MSYIMKIDKQDFEANYLNDDYFFASCYEIAHVVANKYKSQDLQDYIQLAVLRAYTKRPLYKPGKTSAFSYFYRIIHREFQYQIREYLRKKDLVRFVHLLDNTTEESRPEDWIKIGGKWWSAEQLTTMMQEEGTRYKFLKRIRRESNVTRDLE